MPDRRGIWHEGSKSKVHRNSLGRDDFSLLKKLSREGDLRTVLEVSSMYVDT